MLTGLVGDILGDRPHVAVATDTKGDNGLRRFLLALAELAAAGVAVDPAALWAGRAERVDLSSFPRPTPKWSIDGYSITTADGRPVPNGLRPADEAPALSLGSGLGAGSNGNGNGNGHGGRTAGDVVADYLHNLRETVAAERDVLMRYLEAESGGLLAAPAARRPLEVHEATPVLAPAAVGTVGADVEAPAAAPLTRDALQAALVDIVAERTGYPHDMLGPELDLEADLSIDSIKRVEIIGDVAERIGLPGGAGGGHRRVGGRGAGAAQDPGRDRRLDRVGRRLGTGAGARPLRERVGRGPSGRLSSRRPAGRAGRHRGRAHRLPGGHAGPGVSTWRPTCRSTRSSGSRSSATWPSASACPGARAASTSRSSRSWPSSRRSPASSTGSPRPPRATSPSPEAAAAASAEPVAEAAAPADEGLAGEVPDRSLRCVVEVVDAPAAPGAPPALAGAALVVTDDGSGVAAELAARLTAAGAVVTALGHAELLATVSNGSHAAPLAVSGLLGRPTASSTWPWPRPPARPPPSPPWPPAPSGRPPARASRRRHPGGRPPARRRGAQGVARHRRGGRAWCAACRSRRPTPWCGTSPSTRRPPPT